MSDHDDIVIQRGGKNVFNDLGYADADTHLLKAELVVRLQNIVTDRKLTQTEAARAMGVSQPDVSRLLKGQFREISVERIMRMLTRLGCEVDIVVRVHDDSTEYAPIHLAAACV